MHSRVLTVPTSLDRKISSSKHRSKSRLVLAAILSVIKNDYPLITQPSRVLTCSMVARLLGTPTGCCGFDSRLELYYLGVRCGYVPLVSGL